MLPISSSSTTGTGRSRASGSTWVTAPALSRPRVRRRDRALIGHAPVVSQLNWCEEEGVPEAIFTHCGTEIVGSDGRPPAARIKALGKAGGVLARVAHDGLRLTL